MKFLDTFVHTLEKQTMNYPDKSPLIFTGHSVTTKTHRWLHLMIYMWKDFPFYVIITL